MNEWTEHRNLFLLLKITIFWHNFHHFMIFCSYGAYFFCILIGMWQERENRRKKPRERVTFGSFSQWPKASFLVIFYFDAIFDQNYLFCQAEENQDWPSRLNDHFGIQWPLVIVLKRAIQGPTTYFDVENYHIFCTIFLISQDFARVEQISLAYSVSIW